MQAIHSNYFLPDRTYPNGLVRCIKNEYASKYIDTDKVNHYYTTKDEFLLTVPNSTYNELWADMGVLKSEMIRIGRSAAVFEQMRAVQMKQDAVSAETLKDEFVKKCEEANIINDKFNYSGANEKSDVIKNYLQHLICIETNILSLRQRLAKLYEYRIQNTREISKQRWSNIKDKKDETERELKKEKGILASLRKGTSRINRRKVEVAFTAQEPQKPLPPIPPEKPLLQTPGLLNRKKIEAENSRLIAEYEDAVRSYNEYNNAYKMALDAYEKELARYEQEVEDYHKELEKQKALVEQEFSDALKKVKEEIEEKEGPIVQHISELECELQNLSEGILRQDTASDETALIVNGLKCCTPFYPEDCPICSRMIKIFSKMSF